MTHPLEQEIERQCADARATLARLGRASFVPVQLSERRPSSRNGDLDLSGKCWWGDASRPGQYTAWVLCDEEAALRLRLSPSLVWVPHWALPIPTPPHNAMR
jgi:hypothetical protein